MARIPGVLASVWLLVALCGFVGHTSAFFPLSEWLVFFWARAWLAVVVFASASLIAGTRLLQLLGVSSGGLLERYSLAFALGVLTFGLTILVAGYVGILGRVFFFACPVVLVLAAGRPVLHEFRRVVRHLRPLRWRWALPQTPLQALAALFVLSGLFVLYLRVLTPASIGFDARWYHLPIAEMYAVAGRIRPFPEGWYLAAYPHFASILYTWAFLAPGQLSDRLCLGAHLEFVLLLGTVAGVSALAGKLLRGRRLAFGGAALFLFPSIFLTDSNLNGGADGVLAFWAAPIGLALLRYLREANVRHAMLFGALVGAASLTKYQAIYLLVPLVVVVMVDAARRRRWKPALVVAAAALVVSSPHWLKNSIAYHDPLYPNLNRWLPDRPFFHDARAWLERFYWLNGPPRTTPEKLRGVWRALFDFSFFPHGWGATTGTRPLFGSLFTLLLPLLFWVRPWRRVLLLVVCIHAGLAVWYWTYTYDRFLQSILPWMAACTAACLTALWRTERPAVRITTALLVTFQFVWSADMHLLPNTTLRSLLDHVAAGDAKNYARTPYPGAELQEIGKRLANPDARVIGHDFYQSVGAGAQQICDNPAWQGGVEYLELDTPERTLQKWLSLDATHVLFPLQKGARHPEDLARDAVLARATVAHAHSPFVVAGYQTWELTPRAFTRSDRTQTRIAWLGCGERALGIYSPAGLAVGTVATPLTSEELARNPAAALRSVNAIWYRPSCADFTPASSIVAKHFKEILRAGEPVLVVRD